MIRILLLAFVLNVGVCLGQTQKIKAYLDDKQFYAPGLGNYIELNFQFVGYSIKYNNVDGGLQGEVATIIDIKLNDSVVKHEAFRLKSPFMKDSIIDDFYDIRRYVLNPGQYTLNIELFDVNSEGTSVKASKPLYVEDFNTSLSISDIQVSEIVKKGGDETSLFYKSGHTMLPNLSTYYPKELSKLPVYFEIYNSKLLTDSVFGVKQTINDVISGKEYSDLTLFTRHKKSDVVPILRSVDISTLPTGKYTLDFSIMNRDMILLTTKSYEFERSNDIENSIEPNVFLIDPAFQASISNDSVNYYLASLIPMSQTSEIKNILSIIKSKNIENARKYIQGFWIVTAGNNSYEAWMKYRAQVQDVQKLYGNNFQAGYETDRGRVYLQYGSPTTILQKEVSSTEYPYEIWQYNKIGKYSNKRFIFYNPDLVNNGYRLLHSDMIGELKNASWQLQLNKRNTTNGTIDDPNQNIEQNYGGNSINNFRQY